MTPEQIRWALAFAALVVIVIGVAVPGRPGSIVRASGALAMLGVSTFPWGLP